MPGVSCQMGIPETDYVSLKPDSGNFAPYILHCKIERAIFVYQSGTFWHGHVFKIFLGNFYEAAYFAVSQPFSDCKKVLLLLKKIRNGDKIGPVKLAKYSVPN